MLSRTNLVLPWPFLLGRGTGGTTTKSNSKAGFRAEFAITDVLNMKSLNHKSIPILAIINRSVQIIINIESDSVGRGPKLLSTKSHTKYSGHPSVVFIW